MENLISIQRRLTEQAVKKLRRFGFVNVTEENIITDDVYGLYFEKILLLNIGEDEETNKVIRNLLEKLKSIVGKPKKEQGFSK